MSVKLDADGQPLVTSLFDWETGCFVPALLSDPLVVVTVDLGADGNAAPSVSPAEDSTSEEHIKYMIWATQYLKVCPFHKTSVL